MYISKNQENFQALQSSKSALEIKIQENKELSGRDTGKLEFLNQEANFLKSTVERLEKENQTLKVKKIITYIRYYF